ncbi:phosphatidylserine decarboxylase family protein [bacterium]
MLKEYIGLLAAEIVLCTFMLLFWFWKGHLITLIIAIGMFIFIVTTLYFFRDPERSKPLQKDIIIAPADGRITCIRQHQENAFCHTTVTTVSIFLRLWDVHVNRIPVTGKVEFCQYRKGKFHLAMSDKASKNNEQMQIGLVNEHGRFLIRQVAGMIARRIVCRVKEGDTVLQGERFGLIKFGSLVELSIPQKYRLMVHENQNVKAGETIIGILER